MDKTLFADVCIRVCNYTSFAAFIGILICLPFIIRDTIRVKAICHQNFLVSLILLHFSFMSFTVASLLVNFAIFITPNPNIAKHSLPGYIDYASYLGCAASGLLLGSLFQMFFERLFATFFYRTYEGSRKRLFNVVTTILVLIFGGFYGYIWKSGVNFFVNAACFYVLDVVSALLILFLFKLNQRLRRLKNSSNIVLTHRYQIFENLRMLRHVFPMVIWGSLGLVISGGTTISLNLFCRWMGQNTYIVGNYYFSIGNLATLIAYIHMLLRQPHKREAILHFLKHHSGCTDSKVNPETAQRKVRRRNALGDYVVNHPTRSEGDIYFNMLKSDW